MMLPSCPMRPTHSIRNTPSALQRGMAIMSAIFILIVLSVLAAFVVQVSTMQHTASVTDLQSIRTYQAARAGLEWALYQVQPNHGAHVTSCVAGPTTVPLTGDTFAGITVNVTCNGTATLYEITSTACYQPAGGACPNTGAFGSSYIERRIDVFLRTDN